MAGQARGQVLPDRLALLGRHRRGVEEGGDEPGRLGEGERAGDVGGRVDVPGSGTGEDRKGRIVHLHRGPLLAGGAEAPGQAAGPLGALGQRRRVLVAVVAAAGRDHAAEGEVELGRVVGEGAAVAVVPAGEELADQRVLEREELGRAVGQVVDVVGPAGAHAAGLERPGDDDLERCRPAARGRHAVEDVEDSLGCRAAIGRRRGDRRQRLEPEPHRAGERVGRWWRWKLGTPALAERCQHRGRAVLAGEAHRAGAAGLDVAGATALDGDGDAVGPAGAALDLRDQQAAARANLELGDRPVARVGPPAPQRLGGELALDVGEREQDRA